MIFLLLFLFFLKGETGGCGITDDVVEWMDRIQNSAEPDEERPVTEKKSDPPPVVKPWNSDQESPGHKYSREANEPGSHRRTRRATRPKEDKKNNTCSLFIQTDPLIWRHISEQVNVQNYPRAKDSFTSFNSFRFHKEKWWTFITRKKKLD